MTTATNNNGFSNIIQCLNDLKYPHHIDGNSLTIFDRDDEDVTYEIEAEVSNEINIYMVAEYHLLKLIEAVPGLKDDLFSRHTGVFAKYSMGKNKKTEDAFFVEAEMELTKSDGDCRVFLNRLIHIRILMNYRHDDARLALDPPSEH